MEKPIKGSDAYLLWPFLTKNRKKRMLEIVSKRTSWLTVVLEDINHPHNMSAVIRSADAFGLTEIHIIELNTKFTPNPDVSLGAQQWIKIIKHKDINSCIKTLKDKGFKLLAADPPLKNPDSIRLDQIDVSSPVALIFGNELEGLHPELRQKCDGFFHIPMYGFTESFNVSVAVGITLYELRSRIGLDKLISEEEQQQLLDLWAKKSIREADKILKRLKNS